MAMVSQYQTVLATVLACSAATFDWRAGRIPNVLTYGGAAAAIALATFGGSLGSAAYGFAVGGGIALLLYAIANLGGGDAKLIAALGGLLGPARVTEIVGFAFVFGAGWALFALARAGLLQRTWLQMRLRLRTLLTPGVDSADVLPPIAVRFGPILAVATLLVTLVPAVRFVAAP